MELSVNCKAALVASNKSSGDKMTEWVLWLFCGRDFQLYLVKSHHFVMPENAHTHRNMPIFNKRYIVVISKKIKGVLKANI